VKYILLDTNIAIGYVSGNEAVCNELQRLEDEGYRFTFSVITKTELISGAATEMENKFVSELSADTLHIVDNEVSTLAGRIRKEQKAKYGRSVKTPDEIIVATAVQNDIPLFTNDKGMFFAEQYGINVINVI
jgi:tRNA(fMet)-specific endonuclease VapC